MTTYSSFIKVYYVTLVILIICLTSILATFVVALGCMGGGACNEMIETTWKIAAAVAVGAYTIFLMTGRSFLRSNIKKVIWMTAIFVLLLLPGVLDILRTSGVIVY